MDPLSIAGLITGALSLTTQIFAGCIKGYQIFSDAKDVPSQYQYCLTRLRIEQTRLLDWGEQIGLLDTSLGAGKDKFRLDCHVVNDVLLEIQAALCGCLEIQTSYHTFIDDATTPSISPQGQQRISARKTLLDRVLAISDKSSRVASRLQWAMIKKDSFKTLIDKLIAFNDRIESFLDRDALKDIHCMQLQSKLMLIQVTDEVTQLRLLVEALNIAPEPSHQVLQIESERLDAPRQKTRLDIKIANLAQFKADAALIQINILQQPPLRIDLADILLEKLDPEATRSVGYYQQDAIWLEWREQVEDERASPRTQHIVNQRVQQLAAQLCNKATSSMFRAPPCVGYVSDYRDGIPHYALVYKINVSPPSRYSGMQTLREALTSHGVPSLGKRIALASALAESIFYLHATSWLHKGVRSDSIIFIQSESRTKSGNAGGKTVADVTSPILSGFDYSRPDLVDEETIQNQMKVDCALYRHPDLLQFRTRRSTKSHDIYSLGLILIEIAMWIPIEQVVDVEVRRSRLLEVAQSVRRMDDKANHLREQMEARVGEEYVDAVTRCVVGGERIGVMEGTDETDPEIAARMQEVIFEEVVMKLQRLKV